MPLLFHKRQRKGPLTRKELPNPEHDITRSSTERVFGKKSPQVGRRDTFTLTPAEVVFSQIVAASLLDSDMSDKPGLAFAVGLEAERLRAEHGTLDSDAKRQAFVKAVIDEVANRSGPRDCSAIYTDKAVSRILSRCAEQEGADIGSEKPQPTPIADPSEQSSASSSSESECSFRIERPFQIVRFVAHPPK